MVQLDPSVYTIVRRTRYTKTRMKSILLTIYMSDYLYLCFQRLKMFPLRMSCIAAWTPETLLAFADVMENL